MIFKNRKHYRNYQKRASRKKDGLLKRYGNICFYCGDEHSSLTVDHYAPVSKGGTNHYENLRLACNKCNQEKDNLSPEKFIEKMFKVLFEISDKNI